MKSILVISPAILLAGCITVPVEDTLPSPEKELAGNNFQLRLHETLGEKALRGQTGRLATPGLDGDLGAGGKARGCTLTSLGKPPAKLKGTLTIGGCKVTID